MKKQIIIFLLFSWISVFTDLYAQMGLMAEPEPETPDNMDCFAAEDFCGLPSYESRSMAARSVYCPYPSIKLYYKFRAASTAADLHVATMYTEENSTYKLFGPYDTYQEGCSQITLLAATEIESGSSATSHYIDLDSEEGKIYILEVIVEACSRAVYFDFESETFTCSGALACRDCIPQFNPGPGRYIISAWVREAGAAPTKTAYTTPSVQVSFPSATLTYNYTPEGQIIDGWQRIEGIVEVPPGSTDFTIRFLVSSGTAYFDDVRIFPFDGSMMSYVYDPITLRLVAELDERNYAKLYEYDEEGKLIRVKKETEKGIMTMQENRENSFK